MASKNMLVELDCLLDTRISTVSLINEKAAVELLKPEYRKRTWDDIHTLTGGLVDNETFREAYDNRGVETLINARCTAIVVMLNHFLMELEDQSTDSPEFDSTRVDVNVYPYDLSSDEQEMLVTAVMAYAGIQTQVKVVRFPYAEITPKRLKDNYHAVILYDFDKWFSLHVEALEHVRIPRCTMLAPALYVKDPGDEALEIEELPDKTPFEVLEMAVIERLGLELLEPRLFSLVEMPA